MTLLCVCQATLSIVDFAPTSCECAPLDSAQSSTSVGPKLLVCLSQAIQRPAALPFHVRLL